MNTIDLEHLWSILEIYTLGIGRFILPLCLAGFVSITLTFVLSRLLGQALNPRTSVPVTMRVVAVHAKPVANMPEPVFYPEYEIVDGPFKGYRRKSEMTSRPSVHDVGETVTGLYDTKSGEMESDKALRTLSWLKRLSFVVGNVFLLIGVLLWYTA